MKTSLRNLVLSAAVFAGAVSAAQAARPPGDTPVERKTVSGAIRFIGCAPTKEQVSIRIMPGAGSFKPTSAVRNPDGSTVMRFSKTFAQNTQSVRLKLVVPPACTGASVSPVEKTVTDFPDSVAFSVQTPMTSHRIDLNSAVNLIDLVLNSLQLKLHNYQSNDSYIKIGGQTVPFTLPVARVDLDCGTVCPDVGDALFYANDIRLSDGSLTLSGTTMLLRLAFESAGREIKGLHNSLGDNAIPDFEIQNMLISSNPTFYVRGDGRMDLSFANVKMTGSVQSTGGCSPFGIDLCDAVLGTDGKIIRAFQSSAAGALNAQSIRNKIADLMTQYLTSRGINGRIAYYRFSGGNLEVFTR